MHYFNAIMYRRDYYTENFHLLSFCVLSAWKPRVEPPEQQLLKNKQGEKVILQQDLNLQPLDYWSIALPLELREDVF